ncbi:MAG TPA: hypothetical protein DIC42_02515 [Holosporales bacterium]|nr:hypothetical protein [Holosporales bacterium]
MENETITEIQFKVPGQRIIDLIDKIAGDKNKSILDVASNCKSLDVFSLCFHEQSFYLGAMTLKPLQKGGWGGAKMCRSTFNEDIRDYVNQINRFTAYSGSKFGAVEYFPIKTSVDFLFLTELIKNGYVFLGRNTQLKISFSEKSVPVQFDWIYDEISNSYSFKEKNIDLPYILIKKPIPILFNEVQGTFHEIATEMEQKTLINLLNLPPVTPEQTKYISEKLVKTKAPILIPPKNIVLQKIEPSPILTLRSVVEDYESYPVGDLSFLYGSRECKHNDKAKKIDYVKDGNIIRIERDFDYEEKIIKEMILKKMHILSINSYWGQGRITRFFVPQFKRSHKKDLDQCWTDFLTNDIPVFKNKGIHINFDDTFPYSPAVEDDWFLDIESSGIDWFDTEIGVNINNEKINLLPILLKLLHANGSDFRVPPHQDVKIAIQGERDIFLKADRVNTILGFLRSIVKAGGDTKDKSKIKISRLDAIQLDEFKKTGFKDANWSGEEVLLDFAKKLKNFKRITKVSSPKELKADLRPYQKEGLNWFQFLRSYNLCGILADDMGLGKTIQTLAHLLVEKNEGRLKQPVLLIMPTSLVANWESEMTRFAPSLSVKILHGSNRNFEALNEYDILMTTYALVTRDFVHLEKITYSFIILDEAQNIKNKNTQVAKLLPQLKSDHRLCLTGTPLENHLGELWSLFNFLIPGFLGSDRYFKTEFRNKIEKKDDASVKKALATRIKPFMLRRLKSQVDIDLPEKTEIIQRCELSDPQRDLYETVRLAMHKKVQNEIAQKGINKSQIIILDALLKLRQVCCDPRLLKTGHQVTESSKLTMLTEMVCDMVEEGRKILIFSQFTSMLDLIEVELNKMNIPYVQLRGNTKNRKQPVEDFQKGKTPIFLISLKAGGVGLNLTAADTVIHYDPWWNPAVENQATDRAHRIGQNKHIFVYKFIANNTLEEKILEFQAKKAAVAQAIFDTDNKKPSSKITQDDVSALFS